MKLEIESTYILLFALGLSTICSLYSLWKAVVRYRGVQNNTGLSPYNQKIIYEEISDTMSTEHLESLVKKLKVNLFSFGDKPLTKSNAKYFYIFIKIVLFPIFIFLVGYFQTEPIVKYLFFSVDKDQFKFYGLLFSFIFFCTLISSNTIVKYSKDAIQLKKDCEEIINISKCLLSEPKLINRNVDSRIRGNDKIKFFNKVHIRFILLQHQDLLKKLSK